MRTQHTTVPLQPMGCGSTGRVAVERTLRALPGVLEASVNPVTEMAYVEFDPEQCREEEVVAAVRSTGYGETRTDRAIGAPPSSSNGPALTQGRVAVAAALWLAAGFTLCAAGAAVFPAFDGGYRLWAMVLPGIERFQWTTYVLGTVEAFVLGLFSGWLFVWIYDAIPAAGPRSAPAAPTAPPMTAARAGRAS